MILVSQGRLPLYAINTHLFSSQACESTFRSARSLTGPFSSVTNFTVHQFLSKVEKISILNHIKSTEESSASSYALKFPAHHKNRHSLPSKPTSVDDTMSLSLRDIENIITKAFQQAKSMVKDLSITEVLRKNGLDDLESLSFYVLEKKKRSITIDYFSLNSQLDDESSDDDSSDHDDTIDEHHDCGADVSDDDADENTHLTTSKQTFNGMRIYDEINPAKSANYFEVLINGKRKFINKQTAARLLTVNKNRLSSDRLSRVQQADKQQ